MTVLIGNQMNNAYLVYLPQEDDKTKVQMVTGSYSGYEPPEYTAAIDVVVAETPGKAKVEFLKDYYWSNLVYWDEWNFLRVRLLAKDVPEKNGVLGYYSKNDSLVNLDKYWARIHEILDHNNKPCDCPYEEDWK